MTYCVVFSTVHSQEEAEKIAEILLKNRVASCVQFIPITSLYHWQGNIERAKEILLLIKTTDSLYHYVEELIRENHSYEVPQVVKLPISAGLPEYLNWITAETVYSSERN